MTTTITPKTRKATMKLANGTDSSGNVKTVSLNLGSLSVSSWDADKAMAIMTSLATILSKSLHERTTTEESTLTSA